MVLLENLKMARVYIDMKSNYKKSRVLDLRKDNSRKSISSKKGSIPTLAQMTNETLKEIPGSVSFIQRKHFRFKMCFILCESSSLVEGITQMRCGLFELRTQ